MNVKIGICSTAHLHADSYAACLRESDAEFVGVTEHDDRADDAQAKAAEYGVDFYEPDELLERVDGVVVCSTNAAHRDWVEHAADAGVDILCEKPLAPSIEDAEQMVETCREADVHLGVAMPLRFNQPVRNAKTALEDDALGELRFLSGTNRGQMPGGWFADPEQAGGGAVTDHSVHLVDAVRWMTGEEVAEVYAETGTRFHDIAVEDVNVLSMELTDGTEFVLDGSWSKPDEWDNWGDATLRLVGTEGVVSIDCFGQTIKQTRDTDDDPGIRSVFWGSNPDEGLVEDFVRAVEADRPPLKTGADALEDVAVVEAAYESAEQSAPVSVERPTPKGRVVSDGSGTEE
ncbi:Gfo/Idh/MocA family protein [Halogeometricum borinquense]|uniref:Predicted dehydrogenase n=1 Tax=Halogeometricum borinquense (strain ATCC 700274 / DSM 11551 / JCM 10706 / KCTC 4070 / PR3) TaxID=469382 RepID=E4NVJ1_HALBP|nr:Gfo/Idh/MocA family oxidoreductase [Halogeometricum borinquense]ADQ68875.1 predicted dehydrogenase [Halogeometricum borinquense DSM 11551]